jgi:hypothetical protein
VFYVADPVSSICKGRYTETLLNYDTDPNGKIRAHPVLIEHTNDGEYFDCFRAAGNVFATVSSRDGVLTYAFTVHSTHVGQGRYNRDIVLALGASKVAKN